MAKNVSETALVEPSGYLNSAAMRIISLVIALVAATLTWMAVSGAIEALRADNPPPAMSAKALPELGIGADARSCYERLEKAQQDLLDQGIISADDLEASREGMKAYCYTRN
jgi:hypothetical protein